MNVTKSIIRYFSFTVLLLNITCSINALSYEDNKIASLYSTRNWTIENGLPSSTVLDPSIEKRIYLAINL